MWLWVNTIGPQYFFVPCALVLSQLAMELNPRSFTYTFSIRPFFRFLLMSSHGVFDMLLDINGDGWCIFMDCCICLRLSLVLSSASESFWMMLWPWPGLVCMVPGTKHSAKHAFGPSTLSMAGLPRPLFCGVRVQLYLQWGAGRWKVMNVLKLIKRYKKDEHDESLTKVSDENDQSVSVCI